MKRDRAPLNGLNWDDQDNVAERLFSPEELWLIKQGVCQDEEAAATLAEAFERMGDEALQDFEERLELFSELYRPTWSRGKITLPDDVMDALHDGPVTIVPVGMIAQKLRLKVEIYRHMKKRAQRQRVAGAT